MGGRRARLPLMVSDAPVSAWVENRHSEQLIDELSAYDPFTEELIEAMSTPIDQSKPASPWLNCFGGG